MKTSKLKNFAWVFFALALASTAAFAQGWKNGNRQNNQQNGNCLNTISGLSEDQKTQIAAMDENHWGMMDQLREKRRSSANAIEKSEVRTAMLTSVEAHRNAVKSLLMDDQRKQFEQLHSNTTGFGRNQNVGNGRGKATYQGRGQSRSSSGNGNFRGGQRGSRGGGSCRIIN